MSRQKSIWAPVLAVLLVGVMLLSGVLARGLALGPKQVMGSGLAASPETHLEGWPKLTAPFADIPLRWHASGGAQVDRTCVFWDTVSRQYNNAYRYRTDFTPARDPGYFYDYITVPAGATVVYVKPYAVVDGVSVWAEREIAILVRRAVNGGSELSRYDSSATWWFPDSEYEHQGYGYEGGTRKVLEVPIGGTEDDWLYQSQRLGLSGFRCWLNEGHYSMDIEVTLHFAELEATAADQRVFDVFLERGTANEVLIPGIDVFGGVGAQNALVISRTVTVMDDSLDIAFRAIRGTPILNGIVVRGLMGLPQRGAVPRVNFSDDDTYAISICSQSNQMDC